MLVGDRRLELPVVTPATAASRAGDGRQRLSWRCSGKTAALHRRQLRKVWPFGVIADDEQRSAADLIVHVGDYNYRNTPRDMVLSPRVTRLTAPITVKVYDTGDLDDEDVRRGADRRGPTGARTCRGSPIPDTWAAWRDDFFMPAARLMKMAPWLLVRGNHELCGRAGPGWYYLLDPQSALLGGGHGQQVLLAADAGRAGG